MNNISKKFELSSYDIKSLLTDVLIYFVPVGVLALNQLQNTGSIDGTALYGLFISLIIKAGKKFMTDYQQLIMKHTLPIVEVSKQEKEELAKKIYKKVGNHKLPNKKKK